MANEELQQAEQPPVEDKTPLWLYLSGIFLLALLVTLSLIVYFIFLKDTSKQEKTMPPTKVEKTTKVTKIDEGKKESIDQVDSDLNQLEEDLKDLDQIDEELNSPDIDLNLGL